MSIGAATIDALAERLENAELNRTAITKITDDYPELTFEDAYDIQFAIRARKEARGTRIAGLKMGLTSQAKMKQMNVENPLYGFLTDYGALPDGAEISVSNYIHPRIEAEIAIVTNRELKGPGCHIGQVLAATETVLPAVEVLDSRFIDFKFDLPSVVADNTSAASFVTGGRARRVDEVDMPTLGVVLSKNGAIVEVGAGAAVLGHPAESVAMLANMLSERGLSIPAGTFIMTGGITAAVAVAAGDNVDVRYQDLGTLSMRFVA